MIQNNEILDAIKNMKSIYFIAEIISDDGNYIFTNQSEKIIINNKECGSGLHDFTINFKNIGQKNINTITIFAPSEEIISIISARPNKVQISVCFENNNEVLFSGFIIKVNTISANQIDIFFTDISSNIDNAIGDFFSPVCTSDFGDERCKKDLSENTFIASVIDVINVNKIVTNIEKQDDFFLGGYLQIANNQKQFKTRIISHKTNTISVLSAYNFNIGDTINLIQPCEKTVSACKKFNNIINFRGYPFIKNN
ncbi:phage BR0599 family protein [Candidatus Deianiraea vastatrix]|uniref:Phage-derived protein n=1 Tax=Candidatus Deianiraea vastatrix TaxID=2163644 RepID=A0A5B8XG43_9RICK|nr:phage BR0599 family protein [Candidatus Deianiraea vastatrix]QED22937.1 Putative phage-derived protein [Candidatus Deianiraea vastatrix]